MGTFVVNHGIIEGISYDYSMTTIWSFNIFNSKEDAIEFINDKTKNWTSIDQFTDMEVGYSNDNPIYFKKLTAIGKEFKQEFYDVSEVFQGLTKDQDLKD